eukprot:TRINITY_DN6426_c0_g1_i3.p1 TRINITY_DN6426_c0_g1~~TRINITY_DN6426_c0_g1_i3.p1  ORF type:complete len:401 (+),score=78.69 TRINITY_DN6426_c0_g1_i3:91-1293(+)
MSWRLVSGKAVQPPSGKKAVQSAAQPQKDLLAFTVDRPETPEEVKQYRTVTEVGAKSRLPTNQLPVDEHFAFGIRTSTGDKAADVLQPQIPRLLQEELQRKEAIFNHTPIGRAKRTEGNLPEWLAEKEGEVVFGHPPPSIEALSLFATPPETPTNASDKNSLLQPQSTRSRPGAGMSVKRYDDWHVDPLTTVFGGSANKSDVDVAKTLQWSSSNVQNPEKPSRRIKKEGVAFDATNGTFGIRTPATEDIREIIHSTPEAALLADDNLGKSRSADFLKTSGLENTSFGVPSRRETRPPPEHNQHSIQPTAAKPSFQTHTSDTVAAVLSTSKNKSAYQGYWSQPRPKEELKDIVLSAINLSEQDFEAAYARAAASTPRQLSVTDIHNAITQLQLERHQQQRR